MYNDITGIILSGGKSRRMGVNKSFLKLGNKHVIEIISGLMRELFGKVILITNEPFLYSFLKLDIYEDIYKNIGPLGGIHSGLTHSQTEKNFIISCDIPLISIDTIRFIADFPSGKSIIVPYADGYTQQLCGVYSKSCLGFIEEIVLSLEKRSDVKKCPVLELIEKTGGEVFNIEKEMPSGYKPNMFLNMNDIRNYRNAAELYAGK